MVLGLDGDRDDPKMQGIESHCWTVLVHMVHMTSKHVDIGHMMMYEDGRDEAMRGGDIKGGER